ncbi:UDP-N-acetylglucosamine--dolichyl-phosphate N-acetylglucosaminephosphotransferase [Phlyctochytrium planicorne]|nr:UDP-N-acetylglucosamine--dolichyl-phosphate N-acetylglucosaminephosphotransferase [Phlyctochytrium planicorne]
MDLAKNWAPAAIPLSIAVSVLHNPIAVSLCLSLLAGVLTWKFIPFASGAFIKHGRSGRDLLKPDKPVIAESMGLIAGIIYLAVMFAFIPVPFVNWFRGSSFFGENNSIPNFPHNMLGQYLSGILTLFAMLFLGFVDDVVDIRWRVKIWMPLIASIPLLMVYFVTYNGTHVEVPTVLKPTFGNTIDLGFMYYVYMAALCIFSTNAINIIAGANGVEGTQVLVIASSLLLNNIYQVSITSFESTKESHLISIYFLLPLVGVTVGYLMHNWYPARVFGGDTFVYFGGMTFAVVGILGRFSKTVILFMIPQIFNFLYSCPQLFGFVECPRHRMPRYNAKSKLIEYSVAPLKETKFLGLQMIKLLESLGFAKVKRDPKSGKLEEVNNLTLLNLILVLSGPISEAELARRLAYVQILCSILGFVLRYGLAFLIF